MQRKLLTNGNVFKKTDGRWCGVVWYMDEQGNRKRKSFSGTTKQEANKKITAYIAEFENQVELSDESKRFKEEACATYSNGEREYKQAAAYILSLKNSDIDLDNKQLHIQNSVKEIYNREETKGLHSLRHTFATNLVNGVKQPNGTIKALSPKQVADILGHTTSQITEMYYVKKDTSRLNGITDGFGI